MGEQYVVVKKSDGGGLFCMGIFDDLEKAWGFLMKEIWIFGDGYKDEGDEFKYSSPHLMEGECAWEVRITYKAHEWNNPVQEYFYVLINN